MEIAFLHICNDLHYIYSTLQYVLQMSTVLLEIDLKTACKVVNHSYTFCLGDGSGVLCDFLFQFRNCLGILLIYNNLSKNPKSRSLGVSSQTSVETTHDLGIDWPIFEGITH